MRRQTALPGDAITAVRGCYQLVVPVEVDVERAAEDLDAATAALAARDVTTARRLAEAALGVAEQGFVPGTTGLWVERQQAELADLRMRALEVASEAASAAGDHGTAVSAAEAAVAAQPLREAAHVRLMAAHHRAGNRAQALRAYEACRVALAEELGVSPSPATEAAYLAVLRDETGPTATRSRTNVGAELSSFVGRAGQVERVEKLLTTARLVTLVGPGGVGKTRLAARVATRLVDRHPDGAWVVELAPLGDATLLPAHVLAALGMTPDGDVTAEQSLRRNLADRRLLLVLDNCEHLTAACAALVSMLLRAAPGVQVLATSREPLAIAGEHVWPVAPLSVPAPGSTDGPEAMWESDAVMLFVDRASASDPHFAFSGAVAPVVAEICQALDGLPLAIELAAARVRSMSVTEIAARLRDRFGLLVGRDTTAPERHHTLRAAVDWSFDALPQEERALFRRLSVFSGTFTLGAAGDVAAEGDVMGGLTSLVEKSLVVSDTSTEPARYRMLETMRQYGAQKLVEAGEEARFRMRHVEWCVSLAERADAGLHGAEVQRWREVLDDEYDNLQGALGWAEAHGQIELGLRLASAMRRLWEMRWRLTEGRSWFDRLLAAIDEGADVAPLVRARALSQASALAFLQDDIVAAARMGQASLDIALAEGSDMEAAQAWMSLGGAAVQRKDYTESEDHYRRALLAAERAGDRFTAATARVNVGYSLMCMGEVVRARAHFEHSLATRRDLGNPVFIGRTITFLAVVAHLEGRLEEADRLFEESLVMLQEHADMRGLLNLLLRRADFYRARGDVRRAGVLNLEAATIEARVGLQGLGRRVWRAAEDTLRAGDPVMGGYLLGAAQRLLERGAPIDDAAEVIETLSALEREFAGPEFDTAFAEARRLPTEATLLLARERLPTP